MIVVDSSALITILFGEPEKQVFQNIIAGGERCIISAVNAHETASVLRVRHGPQAVARLWQLLTDSEIEIIPFDEVQVRAAAVAFDRYGKGIHPAATMNAPLLFKGGDFTATDVRAFFERILGSFQTHAVSIALSRCGAGRARHRST
jgi:ribonuclease VapC